jgi:hypothetical protein
MPFVVAPEGVTTIVTVLFWTLFCDIDSNVTVYAPEPVLVLLKAPVGV